MITSPRPYNRSNTRSNAPKYATAGGKPSFLRVVVAVGLWGGLDGYVASATLGENESVDGGECRELRLRQGVAARSVGDARPGLGGDVLCGSLQIAEACSMNSRRLGR